MEINTIEQDNYKSNIKELILNFLTNLGKLWQQQHNINTFNTLDIKDINNLLFSFLSNPNIIAIKNRVYLLGGYNGNSATSSVYSSIINTDGTLSNWEINTPLPIPLFNAQVIIIKNYLYILGGRNDDGAISTVYMAPINSNGILGTWTATIPLPEPLYDTQVIINNNKIYLLGGCNSEDDAISTVYTAPINSDGILGDWTTDTPLPNPLASSQAIVIKNKVYLLGGWNNSTVSKVYTASINPNGTLSNWNIDSPLPDSLCNSNVVITKNRVYLLGGYDTDIGDTSVVYTAIINPNGTLSKWTVDRSIPNLITDPKVIVINDKVYLIGICTNYIGPIFTIFVANIEDNGTLSDWSINTILPNFLIYLQALINKYGNNLFTFSLDDLNSHLLNYKK